MNRLQIRYGSVVLAAAVLVGSSGVQAQETTPIVPVVPAKTGKAPIAVEPRGPIVGTPQLPVNPAVQIARPVVVAAPTVPVRLPAAQPVKPGVLVTTQRDMSGQPVERVPTVQLPPLKTGPVKIALPGDKAIVIGGFDKPVVIDSATPKPPVQVGIPPEEKVTNAPPKVEPPPSSRPATSEPKVATRASAPRPASVPKENPVAKRALQMPRGADLPREKTRVPAEAIVEKPVGETPATATNTPAATIVETPAPEPAVSVPQNMIATEVMQPHQKGGFHESPDVPRFRAEAMAALPDTFKDPNHLFSGAASLQLHEAEEARRDYLIGEVRGMLANGAAQLACAPVNVNMPGEAEEKVLVRHVYSECQKDGFWHVVEDTWYDAGGGQVYKRRTYDKKTDQPCKDTNGAQLPEPPQVRQLTSQVIQPQEFGIAVEDGLTVELRCENGLWYRYVYKRYRLQDGSYRRYHSPERVEHTGVPCDQPRPPAVGGTVRIIDAPPLAVRRAL